MRIFLGLFPLLTVVNVWFPLISLEAIPLTGSLSRNLFATLCQILLTLVLTPQDQVELLLLRILEFLKEISSAMAVGLPFRPRALTLKDSLVSRSDVSKSLSLLCVPVE